MPGRRTSEYEPRPFSAGDGSTAIGLAGGVDGRLLLRGRRHVARVSSSPGQAVLYSPSDLVLFGVLGDVLSVDGMMDPERARAAAEALISAGPGLGLGARAIKSGASPTGFGQG